MFQVSHKIKFSLKHYFRVCYSNKTVSIFHMDGNKILRRYVDKFLKRNNKKVTLQQLILRVIEENQRKYYRTTEEPLILCVHI